MLERIARRLHADTPVRRHPLRCATWAVVLFIAWPCVMATASPPPADAVVYHSAGDDGVAPLVTPVVAPGGSATVFLWIDALSGAATPSATGDSVTTSAASPRRSPTSSSTSSGWPLSSGT